MELVNVYRNEWVFRDPTITAEIERRFNDALDAYDVGFEDKAEDLILEIARECPNHIDALHHIGLFASGQGDTLDGYVHCQAAVAIGLQGIPRTFHWEKGRISWDQLDNRPFLRAYFTLATHRMDQGQWQDAIVILKRLLAVNPNDNQGARQLLPKCYFEVHDRAAIIDLYQSWPNDFSPDLVYANALALTLMRRKNEASAAMQRCVGEFPLVAKELLSNRHPKPESKYPGLFTHGGADQAWAYWKEYGRYWRKSKSAMTLLREVAEGAG